MLAVSQKKITIVKVKGSEPGDWDPPVVRELEKTN
jgi:hypothetical protein